MKREEALKKANFLLNKAGKEVSLANFLLMYLLDENPQQFKKNINKFLNEKQVNKFFLLLNEHIEEDKPLSHLLGFDYFYGRKFLVNSSVLSPRMETEELIYIILKNIKDCDNKYYKILDLCTGSGIIAITLKKEIEVETDIFASDISKKALEVAKKNAINLDADINFIESDIFDNIKNKYDILVSNPPYISYEDKNKLKKNVLNYDPHIALFAKENGMYFYRKILEDAKCYLNNDGVIFLEIGCTQGESIKNLAKKYNYNINIIKDLNGLDRIAILRPIF